jgi:hypothetical protein
MKSTLEQLSKNEREAIARLYESDGYKALVKLKDADTVGLGADALIASSMEEVSYLKGRAHQWKVILNAIRDLHKQSQKD